MERAARTRKPDHRSETDHQVSRALDTTSQPLESSTRSLMEGRYNHSFGDVRVHSDREATEALDARAFAVSNHLVFSPGQYAPGTSAGDHLLAHELAHVVQSRDDGAEANLEVAEPNAASEVEAHEAADAVAMGASPSALSTSTTGVVSRSVWDFIPGLGGLSDSKPQVLSDGPGEGVQAAPWAYGNIKESNGYGGINFGLGQGHAQGTATTHDLFQTGDTASASGTYDAARLDGHLGAWDVPHSDGTNGTNFGLQIGGKTPSVAGQLSWTGADGQGGYLQGDASGPSFDVSSYAGTDGFGLGAQAAVGGFNIGAGTTGTDTDEYAKFGLSEGVGAAARGYWGDSDSDGFREYGFGADFGPFSIDMKTEDPVRMLAQQLPLGGLWADSVLGEGNTTESIANEFGLTTRGADLDSTLDVLGDAAGSAYDFASDTASDIASGASDLAGDAWDTVTSWF
jgi:hypothetical protein